MQRQTSRDPYTTLPCNNNRRYLPHRNALGCLTPDFSA